ncbi:hypothetical protein [Clostridium sp.]|uniref:hypothetical protein n=1 Tax=Clostridium sp. TaxID=1506 RepID=UPI002639F63E|nr:hypothetical protein [Clostridium sp.]
MKIYGFKAKGTDGKKTRIIKGVGGSNVATAQGYIRFKFKIERLIRRNLHVKFANCSEGVFIEGAEHMKFEKLISDYRKNPYL